MLHTPSLNSFKRENPNPLVIRSACQIDGKFITSPNMEQIPLPPWHRHPVRVRADQRFGHDEIIQWPQYYSDHYDYLAAIPRKPNDPADTLALMWWNITPDDFIPHPASTIEGFGCILDSKRQDLDLMRAQLVTRIKLYLQCRKDSTSPRLWSMMKLMNHTCARLSEASSTISELQFLLVEFQRSYLEILAFLDYNEIYFNRYIRCSSEGKPPMVANTLGAFTTNATTAIRLMYAGLPVYLIWESNPQSTLSLSAPVYPSTSLELQDSCPPHPSVFETTGTEADFKQKVEQMHGYSRIWMYYDPESNVRSETLYMVPNGSHILTLQKLIDSRCLVPSHKSASASNKDRPSRSKKAPKPSTGRNPYNVLDTPLFRCPSPVWAEALKNVDQHPRHRYLEWGQNPSHGRYALPDPSLLVSPSDDKKKMTYLIAWLRARPSLLFQARKQLTLSQRSQTWREFLEMLGRDTGKDVASSAASVRDSIQSCYAFLLSTSNFTFGLDTSPSLQAVTWKGSRLSFNQSPTNNTQIFREVTWELNEANFRLELFCLDSIASTKERPARSRIERISRCFEPEEFLPVTLPNKNSGMVANDWRSRVRCVLALVEVMRAWDKPPEAFKLSLDELDGNMDQASFLHLEVEAARFYCQTFFGWFGRAASIPRPLFAFQTRDINTAT